MRAKILFAFLFAWTCFNPNSIAQKIRLKDITKIELVEADPWWQSGGFRQSEIVFENNGWNCYQERLKKDSVDQKALRSPEKKVIMIQIRDSIRKFLRPISVKDLEQLLAYINKPDTEFKLKQFNVSTKQLAQWVDSLQVQAQSSLKGYHDKQDSLKARIIPEQKAYFLKITQSKQAVSDAVLRCLHPFLDDDRSYYAMIFNYNDGHKDTVYAYVNSFHIYHLPWRIKNKQSYNPKLTELFESLIGNGDYAEKTKNILNWRIDNELFNQPVLTKASWDDYKQHHLSNYNTLNKTLTPALIYDWRSGYLKSSALPFNIQIRFDFGWDDTLKTRGYNASEKEVTDLYHTGNFFFDYLKAHPTYIAMVNDIGPKALEQAKVIYPDIAKFDYHEVKFINVYVNFYQGWDFGRSAGWLLLPDGKMILLYCSDQLIKDGDKIYADIKPASKDKSQYFCIVYDKQGHKIAGGESKVRIDWNK
ncbi:hypothetical protein FO440_10240 [Mucilaginibacter corticis]|uniref:Uncharacterized protein n=1 Tax=Mucilaginibacter corticis TaxID=2597670 RepID=A0A556MXK3_9SPHI|nr:hypothetical protein [Mucilaginibacter corticis]TSJ44529.1 hypothetical protein FO440_10240 [Mucilaginibacter corticis]